MAVWGIGIAVMMSHFVEGVSGFGCMILALPIVSALIGMKTAVPLLVILSTLFDLALVWKDRKEIRIKEAGKIILITSITMPLGFLALRYCSERLLCVLLGAFMILIAVCGLAQSTGVWDRKKTKKQNLHVLYLPLAGLVQGAFGGSGPFIIVYAKDVLTDKTAFRGTMAAVWVVLNLINLAQYQAAGMLTPDLLRYVIWMIPFLVIGFISGILVHKRISEARFQQFIYCILLIAGVAMAV